MKRKCLVKQGIVICAGLLLAKGVMAETLQSVLQQTVTTNPEIQITAKDRCATAEALNGARAGYLPTLDAVASAGVQHTENPFTNTQFDNDTETLNPRQAGLTADQMLFDGFGTPNEVRRNEAKLSSASFKVAGTAQDIALNATEAYLNVLEEQQLVQIAKQNVSMHDQIYSLINKRSQSGVDVTADLTQSQGRLALAKSNLEAEEANLTDAETNYMQVVGEMPNYLTMPSAPSSRYMPHSEDQAIQMAVANHPTLKSAKEDMTAAYSQHQAAYSKNYPRFDLQLNAVRGQDINGIEGQNNQETALVLMNYNLFNGGADKARQRETAYLYQESGAVMHKTYRQVIDNAQLSWNAWQSATDQLPLLKQHRDASLNSYNAYEQQFQLGKRTLLDSLDAENEYFESSRAYVVGQYNELFAQYRVLNSVGTLLQAEGINLPPQATQPDFT
jgi:outer membrane protein, adhesin transport system